MIKHLLLISLFLTIAAYSTAQDAIVTWTFPHGNVSDTVQNGTLPLNASAVISTSGGTTAITMTNGQATGDYAATATGWDNGADSKSWKIAFFTTGYKDLKISSKHRAGGTNGGPKDFKMQYKIGTSGTWKDLPGGIVTAGNNWTTGVVSNLSLPAECADQTEMVHIRWIMASNNDVNGGTVTSAGISKIDEISVTGLTVTGLADKPWLKPVSTFPNPSFGIFTIQNVPCDSMIEIYNLQGSIVERRNSLNGSEQIFEIKHPGCYLVKVQSNNGVSVIRQIIK